MQCPGVHRCEVTTGRRPPAHHFDLFWATHAHRFVKAPAVDLSTPIWVIVAMALIAAIVGGLIAVIIWTLIALYGISWLLILVLARMVDSLRGSLENARKDFLSALVEIFLRCPEHCRGDVSIPECQIE